MRMLFGPLLLTGLLTIDGLGLADRSEIQRSVTAEERMVRELTPDTAIDASVATLAELRSAMQHEGRRSDSGSGVIWWEGAVVARFQAHSLIRYLPSFLGNLLLAEDEAATSIDLRLSPRCDPESEDGAKCTVRWGRSRFPGKLFGLSPGIDHEEALRRLALDPGNADCKENATWVEGDPAVLVRRACRTPLGDGWSLMWHEDGQYRVASVSASRTP